MSESGPHFRLDVPRHSLPRRSATYVIHVLILLSKGQHVMDSMGNVTGFGHGRRLRAHLTRDMTYSHAAGRVGSERLSGSVPARWDHGRQCLT